MFQRRFDPPEVVAQVVVQVDVARALPGCGLENQIQFDPHEGCEIVFLQEDLDWGVVGLGGQVPGVRRLAALALDCETSVTRSDNRDLRWAIFVEEIIVITIF